jgi:cytochrome c1
MSERLKQNIYDLHPGVQSKGITVPETKRAVGSCATLLQVLTQTSMRGGSQSLDDGAAKWTHYGSSAVGCCYRVLYPVTRSREEAGWADMSAAYSPDSSVLAATSGGIQLRDVSTEACRQRFDRPDGDTAISLTFSPDGNIGIRRGEVS